MGAMASRITSLTIGNSTVFSVADQRKHNSSESLAFVRGIHRWPVNSPHKWPVTRKCFHLMTSSWKWCKPRTHQFTYYIGRLRLNHWLIFTQIQMYLPQEWSFCVKLKGYNRPALSQDCGFLWFGAVAPELQYQDADRCPTKPPFFPSSWWRHQMETFSA